jgi:FKBP-type peptidyl-prolyl cis-trans isomerase 2
MIIEKNVVVSLTYTLRKNESTGEVIEVCEAARPLEFVCESGSMLPGFEKNIKGFRRCCR